MFRLARLKVQSFASEHARLFLGRDTINREISQARLTFTIKKNWNGDKPGNGNLITGRESISLFFAESKFSPVRCNRLRIQNRTELSTMRHDEYL